MGDIVSSVVFDRAEGRVHFVRSQDCQPIVDAARQWEQEAQKGDLRHVASIPLVIVEKWINEDNANILGMGKRELTTFLRKKLAGDYSYLRTAPKLPPYRAPKPV